jgi:hypothetical protein
MEECAEHVTEIFEVLRAAVAEESHLSNKRKKRDQGGHRKMTVELFVKPISNETFITSLELPPFDELPEVIIWGSRVFKISIDSRDLGFYEEAFCWWAPGNVQPKNADLHRK